jgi:hypothetical protein
MALLDCFRGATDAMPAVHQDGERIDAPAAFWLRQTINPLEARPRSLRGPCTRNFPVKRVTFSLRSAVSGAQSGPGKARAASLGSALQTGQEGMRKGL